MFISSTFSEITFYVAVASGKKLHLVNNSIEYEETSYIKSGECSQMLHFIDTKLDTITSTV